MNKLFTIITLILLVPFIQIGAVEIAEQELESVSGSAIDFINYEGPHEKIETIEQIKGIGTALSVQTDAGETTQQEREYAGKYRVQHIVAPAGAEGYNADIFIIEEDAQVDHIENVRRILSGYIESAYGLSPERASALAMFTTYYNAIYRKDIDFFSKNYSEPVINALDPQKVGISRSYNEWPGSTQMVLPLTQLEGAAAPSAESLSTEKVVEEMRTREDKGVEERKEVVEMREEELEEDQRQLEQEKQQAGEEARQAEEQPQTSPQREAVGPGEAAEAPESAETAATAQPQQEQTGPGAGPAEEQEGEDFQAREEELQQREEDIAEERESIAEDQQQLIEEQAAAEEEQEARQETAQTGPDEAAAAIETTPTTYPFPLFRQQNGELYGRMVLIKPNGTILARSTVNTIRSRETVIFGNMHVVIAGESTPPRVVRLMGLDAKNLEVIAQSEVNVYADSPILKQDDSLFCVISDSGAYYLGKFDSQLRLQEQSEDPVLPYTQIRVTGDYLVAQTGASTVERFRIDDLSSAD